MIEHPRTSRRWKENQGFDELFRSPQQEHLGSEQAPIAVQDQELEAEPARPGTQFEETTPALHSTQKSRRYLGSKNEAIAILALLGITFQSRPALPDAILRYRL